MCHRKQKLNKRLMALTLAVLLCLGLATAAFADGESGQCGDNLAWSLSAGTLTVSGSGEMWDFTESSMAPWYPLRSEILRLSLPEGLVSIGDLAFYDCMKLDSVSIPGSVVSIGDYAFASCDRLSTVGLDSGLRSIGDGTFYGCWKLVSARLSQGLQSIGSEAFYDCRALTSVVIPSSVTDLGSAAFAYCTSLVRAEVNCQLSFLPDWTFFGCSMLSTVILPDSLSEVGNAAFRDCDMLSSVSYGGSGMTMEELESIIDDHAPGFGSTGSLTDVPMDGPSSSVSVTENGDGTVFESTGFVTEGENASVSSTIDRTINADGTSAGSYRAEVNVTVDNNNGWTEAKDAVNKNLSDINNIYASDGQSEKVYINVYVPDADTIDPTFVESLAGRDVTMTVNTQNGSSWVIDCSKVGLGESEGIYDLSYTIEKGSPELCEELGVAACFVLRFAAPAEVNAEVLIRLGDTWSRQNASLFQRDGRNLQRHQNVVVDGEGCAHFYLASVNAENEYYIAMNLPVPENNAIIPDTLLAEYGEDAVRYDPIEYEITGRTSSWGMNIKQVTWIMVGVMVVVVLVVGVTMFTLNKRKLKAGYIPELDYEDEEY